MADPGLLQPSGGVMDGHVAASMPDARVCDHPIEPGLTRRRPPARPPAATILSCSERSEWRTSTRLARNWAEEVRGKGRRMAPGACICCASGRDRHGHICSCQQPASNRQRWHRHQGSGRRGPCCGQLPTRLPARIIPVCVCALMLSPQRSPWCAKQRRGRRASSSLSRSCSWGQNRTSGAQQQSASCADVTAASARARAG